MFSLPTLDTTGDAPAKKQIIEFGSYNDSPTINDGDMRDMQNLSSDEYPFITQRKPRGIYNAQLTKEGDIIANTQVFTAPSALLSRRGKLAVCDGQSLYFGETEDGSPKLLDYITLTEETPKSIAAINNKICIFPDKIWFDVRDEEDIESSGSDFINNKWGKIENIVSVYETTTGETIDGTWGRNLQPITRDSDDEEQSLVYTAVTPEAAENAYYDSVRFSPGDSVAISGFSDSRNNITSVIQKVTIESAHIGQGIYEHTVTLSFPPSSFQAVTAADIESGDAFADGNSITIARRCPDLSHVMESDNRLWGTCDEENAIYSCKQGDPTNWYYYREGLASNSYAVSVATDGNWTGCCAYGAHLCFFKENYIHRLYGTKPANYQINTIEAQSVEEGSARSIVVVNNTLFYKSRLGIMAYSGNIPELISEHFGTAKYKNVVAGTNGMKLYFSMESCDREGVWDFIVFDVQKVMWHKEDHLHLVDITSHNGKMVFAEYGKKYLTVIDADVPVIEQESELGDLMILRKEEHVKWFAVFGDFDEYVEDKKIYSKMQLRLKMSDGSDLTVSVMTDESGNWEEIMHVYTETKRSVYVPIVPRRCDKFRIKIEGTGRCRIESLAREYREGSEV